MARPTDSAGLVVRDLGRLPYCAAYELQRETHARVVAGESGPTVLLVEHPPVVTIGRRPGAREHLVAGPARFASMGIEVLESDRGGDVTYHGPGQVVVYPVVPLSRYGLNVGRYIRLLERVLIDVAGVFGVAAHAQAGCTGVWVAPGSTAGTPSTGQAAKKLCAIGIRVQRNVTLHGAAINVDPDLSHFETIVPCGLAGRGVTSFKEVLGVLAPASERVKSQFVATFGDALGTLRAARAGLPHAPARAIAV